jgi:hypothetical protein
MSKPYPNFCKRAHSFGVGYIKDVTPEKYCKEYCVYRDKTICTNERKRRGYLMPYCENCKWFKIKITNRNFILWGGYCSNFKIGRSLNSDMCDKYDGKESLKIIHDKNNRHGAKESNRHE